MKTLNLNVLDRIKLQELLPRQGGKIEMLLVESIAKKIDFSLDEISEFGLKDIENRVSWAHSRDTEFEFTVEQVGILKSASKRADDEKIITLHHLPVIEKIDNL